MKKLFCLMAIIMSNNIRCAEEGRIPTNVGGVVGLITAVGSNYCIHRLCKNNLKTQCAIAFFSPLCANIVTSMLTDKSGEDLYSIMDDASCMDWLMGTSLTAALDYFYDSSDSLEKIGKTLRYTLALRFIGFTVSALEAIKSLAQVGKAESINPEESRKYVDRKSSFDTIE